MVGECGQPGWSHLGVVWDLFVSFSLQWLVLLLGLHDTLCAVPPAFGMGSGLSLCKESLAEAASFGAATSQWGFPPVLVPCLLTCAWSILPDKFLEGKKIAPQGFQLQPPLESRVAIHAGD